MTEPSAGATGAAPASVAENPEGTPILVVRALTKSFGGVRAVDGADLAVGRGSITALIGPNGAGKTTLFNLVTGFVKPDRGSVELDGESISGRPPHAIARRGMVRTFQLTKALAGMTVLDNMLLGAQRQPGELLLGLARHPLRWRHQERGNREQAMRLLERFRLTSHADAYAGTLSTGQRKLLELARLLMREPRVVLLDEPLAGVNPALGDELLAHVRELRDERAMTFLFIEHDIDAVMRVAERIIVMACGATIAAGPPADIRQDPGVIDAYLGARTTATGEGAQ